MPTPYIANSGDWCYKLWLGQSSLGNPADFPRLVYIWRGSCQNTPQLIYKHVRRNTKKYLSLLSTITRVFTSRDISIEIDPLLLVHLDCEDKVSTNRIIRISLNRLILNIGILQSRLFATSNRLKWFDKAELIEKIYGDTNELRIKITEIRAFRGPEDLTTISEDFGVGMSVSIAEKLFNIKRSTVKKIDGTGKRPDWKCQTQDDRILIVEAKGSTSSYTSNHQEIRALQQKTTQNGDVQIASLILLNEHEISTNRFLDPPIESDDKSPIMENHILRAGHYASAFSFLGNSRLSRYYSQMKKRLEGMITPFEQDLKNATFRELRTNDPTIEFRQKEFVGSFYQVEEDKYFFVGIDKRLLSYSGFIHFEDYESDITDLQYGNNYILYEDGILLVDINDINQFDFIIDKSEIRNYQEKITVSDIDAMTEISFVKYFIYLLKEVGFEQIEEEVSIGELRVDLVGYYNNEYYFFEFKINKRKKISNSLFLQVNKYRDRIERGKFILVTNADIAKMDFTLPDFTIIDRNGLKDIAKNKYRLIELISTTPNNV